ncbi:hypothetical protein ABZW18_08380 [Streptomyces sp. NPDC004647]|uniref:hypothetical protein n=1 Tax=Streptomyces sp. NPDC004647 TaxID=3154671 RepID=UPI0033AB34CD
MSGGYGADPEALAAVAKGIDAALAELTEVGMIGEASTGRGFEGIALSGLEVGHGELTGALEEFCSRWEWGVRALMTEGNEFAAGLGLAAGAYHESEEYGVGALKVAANAAVGNPHASEDEVTKQSFGGIWDSGHGSTPDYSGESFRQAQANQDAGWDAALGDDEGGEQR